MRILIIGIDSNVGSIIEKHIRLLRPEWEIIGTVKPGGERENRGDRIWTADLTSENTIEEIFSQIGPVDAVVHLAAAVHAEGRLSELAERLNFVAPTLIAEILLQKNPGLKYIFASTIAVYGETFESEKVDEETPCRPASAYAKTKYAAEKNLCARKGENGFHPIIIRIGTVISRTDRGNLNQMMAHIERFRFFIVSHPRRVKKAFVHVGDLSQAILLLISGEPKSSVYNLTGPVTNMEEILRSIRSVGLRFCAVRLPRLVMMILIPKLLNNVPVASQRFSDEFHFRFKTFAEGFAVEYAEPLSQGDSR